MVGGDGSGGGCSGRFERADLFLFSAGDHGGSGIYRGQILCVCVCFVIVIEDGRRLINVTVIGR